MLCYVTALHEGVALGAATYYAAATGRTAAVNVHVAPGLGNALGMLYSAYKANAPLLVTAGQQDTRMRLRDPLLGHDLVGMAAPVTKWSAQVERADEMGPLLRRALKIAGDAPSGPVFVALPIDVMEQETAVPPAAPSRLHRAAHPDPAGVAELAGLLLASKRPAIVVGDDVARAGADRELVAAAERLGAAVWFEGLRQQASFPTGHPNARSGLPFDAAGVRTALAGADLVLLVGGPFFEEVWFSPGEPFPDGAAVVQIEESPERLAYNFPLRCGLVGALAPTLAALVNAVAATPAAAARNAELKALKEQETAAHQARLQKAWDRRPISMARAMAEIRRAAPADVVVVDETITANLDLVRSFDFQRPGDYFSGRGGGIGQGLAGALGVKLAYPDRPVVAISGDGSAMYSIQALWTAAHHDLAIVFVILANREYRVLKHNLDIYRQRFGALSNRGYPNMDLATPELDFVALAKGMGVAGERVENPDELGPAVARAFASGRPQLIEAAIEGKK
jgi:benzoylformate decarboxylase